MRESRLVEQVLPFQHLEVCLRGLLGLALQVLDAAGGATGVAFAAVQDVRLRVLFYRQD
jgi:hypothetical protein